MDVPAGEIVTFTLRASGFITRSATVNQTCTCCDQDDRELSGLGTLMVSNVGGQSWKHKFLENTAE